MRPKLSIGPLTSLQDARSSAAVGFDYILFSLARGSSRKLPANMIWSLMEWLSGPEILLELNAASAAELTAASDTAEFAGLVMPAPDYLQAEWPTEQPIWLQMPANSPASAVATALEQAGPASKVILAAQGPLAGYQPLAEQLFLHFPTLDEAEDFVKASDWMPYGLHLGPEAEEEPGVLHYERIDEFLEVLAARFGEE